MAGFKFEFGRIRRGDHRIRIDRRPVLDEFRRILHTGPRERRSEGRAVPLSSILSPARRLVCQIGGVMRAAFFESTGGPDVIRIGELPLPEPKAGEVRVRVTAAALNPIDVYIRAGMVQMPRPTPTITGTD